MKEKHSAVLLYLLDFVMNLNGTVNNTEKI